MFLNADTTQALLQDAAILCAGLSGMSMDDDKSLACFVLYNMIYEALHEPKATADDLRRIHRLSIRLAVPINYCCLNNTLEGYWIIFVVHILAT